jgi:acetyl esterase/lipase
MIISTQRPGRAAKPRKQVALAVVTSMLMIGCSGQRAELNGDPTSAAPVTMAYGPDPAQSITVWKPPTGTGPEAVLVYVHGGGWSGGSPTESSFLTDLTAGLPPLGIEVASVGYRLAPAFPWPAALDDVTAGLQALLADGITIDPARVVLMGESAGGQLAALVGIGDRPPVRPALVVTVAAPADLTQPGFVGPLTTQTIKDVFAPAMKSDPFALATASPINYLTAGDPPMLVLHGTADPIVPITQSRAMVTKADSVSVVAELIEVVGGDHPLRAPAQTPTHAALVELLIDRIGTAVR